MEEFDSSKNTRILWSMLIGSIVTFAVLYGPQTLIQQYTVEFDLSASQASLVVSIATFTLAISMLIIVFFKCLRYKDNHGDFSSKCGSVKYCTGIQPEL